jgi:pimeloyl-ACP methyl ester carboxylesterase
MATTRTALAPEDLVGRLESACRTERTPFAGGRSMVWRLWGSGPPVVLLHGGYGSWRHYVRNIEPLARDFTVVAPDMPGFGDSDTTPGLVTVDWMAETVASGARAVLGAGTAYHVVGFSFGSVISGHMPRFATGAMVGLVVVAYNRLGLWELRRPEMKNWRRAKTREELDAAQRFNLAQLMIHDPARIDDLAVYLQIENTRRSRVRSLDIARTHDLPARLVAAAIPVAAIWGEHDVTLRTGVGAARDAFERLFPGAPCVVIAGAGHWVQYEAADAFDRAVRDLVRATA